MINFLPTAAQLLTSRRLHAQRPRPAQRTARLTSVLDKRNTTTLRQLTYAYEGRDNLTTISDVQTPLNSETYGYTPRESLASANGPYGTSVYAYDAVGNRVSYAINPGAGVQTDVYTYPATSNKLSAISLGAGGSRAFTYDAAGNVTYDNRAAGGYGYTYNAAGRMSEFTISGVLKASYKYDFAERQAIRTLAGGVTIHSVFDSAGNRIAEYNEATGALIREYVWFNGAPLAVIEGGVTTFIRTDHIGRPVFGTNTGGTKVWTAAYLPFGGVRTTTGTPINARFPGQWFQSESGLHQNWMRDYDPTTGRYVEADPLGLVDGASVYGYAGQNPGRWVDPRGLEAGTIFPDWDGGAARKAVAVVGEMCTAIGTATVALAMSILMVTAGPAGDGSTCDGQCSSILESKFPPGFWEGDKGAEEWGRRNGVGAKEGKRRFHDLKGGNKGSGAKEDFGVNPGTGEVVNGNGESAGNLDDED